MGKSPLSEFCIQSPRGLRENKVNLIIDLITICRYSFDDIENNNTTKVCGINNVFYMQYLWHSLIYFILQSSIRLLIV